MTGSNGGGKRSGNGRHCRRPSWHGRDVARVSVSENHSAQDERRQRIVPRLAYLLPAPAVLIAANVVNGIISGPVWPFDGAAGILACTGMGLYASRRGKFVVWTRLLEQLSLRGNERILTATKPLKAEIICSPAS